MSKIEQLIKEKCPNGVKYVKLKDICNFKRGQSITIKNLKKGNYPVIAGGQVPSFYCDIYNRDYECITVSSSGAYAGCLNYWNNKILCTDSFSITSKNKNIVNNKFLFHCLEAMQECIYSMKKGAGIPHIHISDIDKLKIPVPPIEIQEEIVRILDKFSELEAELEAELEVRKKQYEFWYRRLFEFDNKIYYSLINVCDYVDYRGKTPKKVDNGIFLVTAKNIKMGYIDYECSKEYISTDSYDNVMKRGKPKLGDVLFTTEAPCGHVAQVDNDTIALAQRVIKYSSKNIKVLTNNYLKYVLLSPQFQNRLLKSTNGGTVKGIKGSTLHKMKIPIPPLEEQERIVKILDKFDKLVNDISEGIPAEIEARRKQYEYYRNKLLSFKEF